MCVDRGSDDQSVIYKGVLLKIEYGTHDRGSDDQSVIFRVTIGVV